MKHKLNSHIAHITSESKAVIERNEMALFTSEESANIHDVRGFPEENERAAPR
jgi:hypothetical protein